MFEMYLGFPAPIRHFIITTDNTVLHIALDASINHKVLEA
jgi:hypothetical protein